MILLCVLWFIKPSSCSEAYLVPYWIFPPLGSKGCSCSLWSRDSALPSWLRPGGENTISYFFRCCWNLSAHFLMQNRANGSTAKEDRGKEPSLQSWQGSEPPFCGWIDKKLPSDVNDTCKLWLWLLQLLIAWKRHVPMCIILISSKLMLLEYMLRLTVLHWPWGHCFSSC